MKTIVGLFFMLAVSMPAHAQILRCVDKSGKVVGFASECPAGTTAQQTGIRNNPSAAPAKPAPSVAEQQADAKKRQLEQAEADKKAAEKQAEDKQRQAVCQQSRVYLKSLQSGQRIANVDPKTGERVFLEDSQYAGEIAKAQQSVNENCR